MIVRCASVSDDSLGRDKHLYISDCQVSYFFKFVVEHQDPTDSQSSAAVLNRDTVERSPPITEAQRSGPGSHVLL